MPVLELAGATVVKSDRRVLDNLNLTIPAGRHTAIVGPNGAGKSLLVKLLTHEVRALVSDDGQSTVRVFGNGLALAGRPIGGEGDAGTTQALLSWDGGARRSRMRQPTLRRSRAARKLTTRQKH